MKALDFVKWLDGFLDRPFEQIKNEDLAKMKKKMELVDMEESYPELPQFPFGVIDRVERNDGKVPFHTICGCRVCGCTMANDMVYPDSFSQINSGTTNATDI